MLASVEAVRAKAPLKALKVEVKFYDDGERFFAKDLERVRRLFEADRSSAFGSVFHSTSFQNMIIALERELLEGEAA